MQYQQKAEVAEGHRTNANRNNQEEEKHRREAEALEQQRQTPSSQPREENKRPRAGRSHRAPKKQTETHQAGQKPQSAKQPNKHQPQPSKERKEKHPRASRAPKAPKDTGGQTLKHRTQHKPWTEAAQGHWQMATEATRRKRKQRPGAPKKGKRQTPTQPPKGKTTPGRAEAPEHQKTTTNHNHQKKEKHLSGQKPRSIKRQTPTTTSDKHQLLWAKAWRRETQRLPQRPNSAQKAKSNEMRGSS